MSKSNKSNIFLSCALDSRITIVFTAPIAAISRIERMPSTMYSPFFWRFLRCPNEIIRLIVLLSLDWIHSILTPTVLIIP